MMTLMIVMFNELKPYNQCTTQLWCGSIINENDALAVDEIKVGDK